MKTVSVSVPLSQRVSSSAMHEVIEAVQDMVNLATMGATLLLVLRLEFQLLGSETSSVAQYVDQASAFLVVPFTALPPVPATIAAMVAVTLIAVIVGALFATRESSAKTNTQTAPSA